jgi:nucleotide-binding universal stress UspA family protein
MHAVRWAAMIARSWGARITLLHTAVPTPTRSSLDTSPAAARRAEEAARRRGEAILRKAATLVEPPTSVEQEVAFGQPAETILRRIRELEAQLVVLGSTGKGLIKSLLLGSTSIAVTREAHCSVLVVRRGQGRRSAQLPVVDDVARDPEAGLHRVAGRATRPRQPVSAHGRRGPGALSRELAG